MDAGGLHFVDLVEHENRVGNTRFDNLLDDAARHSTYIGATMATQLGLVVQTAEGNTTIRTVECCGYGTADGRFPCARGTYKAEHLGFGGLVALGLTFENGEILNDALFDFLDAKVVTVHLVACFA